MKKQIKMPKEITTLQQFNEWIGNNKITFMTISKSRDGLDEIVELENNEVLLLFCNGRNELNSKVSNFNRIFNFYIVI
jgi:hypothetical protein